MIDSNEYRKGATDRRIDGRPIKCSRIIYMCSDCEGYKTVEHLW